MKKSPLFLFTLAIVSVLLPACQKNAEQHHEEPHKILVTGPMARDVTITQQYVCQIHSSRHIEIRALESGYLETIPVKEGQSVKAGETMFTILPTLYQAKRDAELAEVQLAQIELTNTQRLFQQNVVAQPEVALAQAKLAKAQANLNLVKAELAFATIKAPFDGIIDHQNHQHGSLISEGDMLTTLSDNSVMWVYFNVPEVRYLEYKVDAHRDELKVELMLANGNKFPQIGKIGAVEADFNNETGNIAFRADFPNPDGLLRHGQTGTILLSRVLKDAIVIPQRATFEILAKKYAFVVEEQGPEQDAEHGTEDGPEIGHAHGAEHADEHADEHAVQHGVAHQREIVILNELDDIYLIKEGLSVSDKIVLEGIRQVRDGEDVAYEYVAPAEALAHLKYHAE